jgi:starch synthase
MVENQPRLVGVLGSGDVGRDPFDRRSWSGLSYYFFTELARQGHLHRAFGVEAPSLLRGALMLRNFHPDRRKWRNRFYLDLRYRKALTDAIQKRIEPADLTQPFLQLGAYYNVPSVIGDTPCYSYHDGNLACALRAPYPFDGPSARQIDRALAYEAEVALRVRKVFAMSGYLRDSFISDYGVPPDRVVAIGAGMNIDSIPAYRPHKDFTGREILFIGVHFERKGGTQLLDAFRAVRAKYSDAVLHIVGPRDLEVPAHLQAGVQVHGFLNRSEAPMQALFERCTLFVMPSLYEPFGVAPLEAMAHQIPAVVSNGWALREIVTSGITGELVEVGSADDLADKLLKLLAEPHELRAMGGRAREFVLQNYTWERVVTRLVSHLKDSNSSDAEQVGVNRFPRA